jgi:hypothetical protein
LLMEAEVVDMAELEEALVSEVAVEDKPTLS